MKHTRPSSPRGRGAASNPPNRFEPLVIEDEEPEPDQLPTVYLRDASRTILTRNQSPDIPFDVSINPYRGCEHGCTYCYARPSHELLGFSAGLDFETRIVVKHDAPTLLLRALDAPSWRPQLIGMSGVTDPYQPIERRLALTRGCLEVLASCRNPVGIVTKNALVVRDRDLLARLARHDACSVLISITTLDRTLARTMEPRASTPQRRLDAIRTLADAKIPVGVLVAPIIPGLNEHEIPTILARAADAGASSAGCGLLRLPGAVAPLFEDWLERAVPDRKAKVLNRIRSVRGGRLNDPRFVQRMRGHGPVAKHIRQLFHLARRRSGLDRRPGQLSCAAFRRPSGTQLDLFP